MNPSTSNSGHPEPAWIRHLRPDDDPRRLDLTEDGTLVAAWTRRWAAEPSRPLIHDPIAGWIPAGRLDEDTAAAANAFAEHGLAKGDRILCSAASSYRLVVAHVAALRLGLVVVPANLAYQRREISHLSADAGVSAAVVDDIDRGRWISEASPGAVVFQLDRAWARRQAASARLDDVSGHDPALICYTSGTTGQPKGAVLSHRNLLASTAAVTIAWRWTDADRLVLCLPLFHAHGLAVGLHGTLYTGGSAVLMEGFDCDGVLDAIEEHAATLFFGVPTMYTRLAASARVAQLAKLRLCVSGSAPLGASTWQEVADRAGQEVLERYGMTETLMNVSNPYDGPRRPGSVGLPLPHVELRLDGSGLDGPGEILLRGPNVFNGYWNRPDATAEAFTDDGWFKTGDLGTTDDEGYLTIVGRSKELIITGGYNVYPREVEDVLSRRPDVAEVAVVGTPSDEWGETVTAFVVPATPGRFDVGAFLALAGTELAAYKRPRAVHVVDAIPRNALGKVLRQELSKQQP